MSSPNINNVLLIGCVICYSSVFIKPIEVSSDAHCKVCYCHCLNRDVQVKLSYVMYV